MTTLLRGSALYRPVLPAPCATYLDSLQEKGGIPPALQKLSYAGKHFEDSQRTLQQ